MRRLILCFDGTWNGRSPGSPSNIEHLAACFARKESGPEQVVWYMPGVGTQYAVDKLLGGAFGFGIASAILAGYRFLSINYSPGDQVSLCGFSRGAFAARSLANLIAYPGLLWPEWLFKGMESIWAAYNVHSRAISAGHPEPASAIVGLPTRENGGGKGTTVADIADDFPTWTIPVAFLGVFDTVGALGRRGLHSGDQWHNMQLHPSVSFVRHALAIDEHRIKFAPIIWKTPAAAGSGERTADSGRSDRIKQVWFQGAHSDVGGGASTWWASDSLSTNALLWMLREGHWCADLDINMHTAAVAIGGMGNPSEQIHDSLRWWWWPTNLGRVARQAVAHDPDFQGYYRNLRPPGADNVLVASSSVERFQEKDGYGPRNLRTVAEQCGDDFTGILEHNYRSRGMNYEAAKGVLPEILTNRLMG